MRPARASDVSPLESDHAMNTARWRCLLCAADGIGGLKSWGVHYMNTHYALPERVAGVR
jgi:hypothetical protein